MKLKKKITRDSYNYSNEEAYYREAKVCPHCGNREEFSSSADEIMAAARGKLTIIVGRFMDGSHGYECKKCGCQWEVKKYKG